MDLSEEQAKKLGEQIIEILNLKTTHNDRVCTEQGMKTLIGLGRLIENLYKDIKK